jgi:hypothetical protein
MVTQTFAEVGKLYLTSTHTTANIGQTVSVEIKGTVNLIVYGTENDPSTVTDENDLTAASEALTYDSYYPFYTPLPKYIAFVGTADLINISGYELTYVKDLT